VYVLTSFLVPKLIPVVFSNVVSSETLDRLAEADEHEVVMHLQVSVTQMSLINCKLTFTRRRNLPIITQLIQISSLSTFLHTLMWRAR